MSIRATIQDETTKSQVYICKMAPINEVQNEYPGRIILEV